MNYEWVLHTLYDEQAYRALAEASWQIFRRPKMQAQAYPILIAAAVMTLIAAFLGERSNRLPAAVLILFFGAAIPLSKVSAKSKMYRTAKKAAEAAENFPAKVIFFLIKQRHIFSTQLNLGTRKNLGGLRRCLRKNADSPKSG